MAIGSPQWMYSSGEYEIEQSLKFNDDDSAYLSWTPSSAGNRKTWTWSGWVKRGNLTGSQMQVFSAGGSNGNNAFVVFEGDNTLLIQQWTSFSNNYYLKTNQVFRDVSAWYHIVLSFDTTQATSSDRIKVWVNGEQVTSFSTATYPSQNFDTRYNSSEVHALGCRSFDNVVFLEGYLAEVNFIDGQALTPADFGETGDYGEWKPIEYSGTYGTNGFYLPFKQDYTVEGFSTVTYKGNGGTQYIGGVGFQPDLLWVKARTTTTSHMLNDSVRGAGKTIYPNLTNAESTGTVDITAFETDGFTVGAGGSVNGSSDTFVAWNWDMGGSNATNTDGSITSTVRANTTYGQSIVSYTGNSTAGATVGHGLSSAPEMVFVKNRDVDRVGYVLHTGLNITNGEYIQWNNNIGSSANNVIWNSTLPSSSVVTLGSEQAVNGNGEAMIAYCFHSVTGYSKIGSYSGTGSNVSVTTGFTPAFVMIKRTDSTGNWYMQDAMRPSSNGSETQELISNDSRDETNRVNVSLDSNGFTIGTSGSEVAQVNASGGTYIYMAFADKREYAYWLDQSGNNNDWTSNNLTESDISVDSPTNNFATMNPLDKDSDITLYEGNTRAYSTNSGGYACTSTISTDSGKWYAEINSLVLPASTRVYAGWALNNYDDSYSALDDFIIHNLGSFQRYVALGSNYDNVSTSFAAGDILQLAWDMDAGKFWFGKNGTWINSGNPTNGTNATVTSSSVDSVRVVYRVSAGAGTTGNLVYNFGQDSSFAGNKTAQGNQDGNDIGDFYYTPPTGFLALCTKNLPDVDVVPSEHFNTVLYSGNNATSLAITGVGFQPDFLWLKRRDSGASHYLVDAVRGRSKGLLTNGTTAEYTTSDTTRDLRSFDSDGFTVGQDYYWSVNTSGATMVAWNWKANGSGSSNTNGSITSTVSANVDAGFSVVSYTGGGAAATIGHGLSSAPEMVVVKRRESGGWIVGHESAGWGYRMNFESTAAKSLASWAWNNTAPTSSVFSVGSDNDLSASGGTYIAYAFHSVDGYSKVGSYTGNGSTDGVFVNTGFRPKFLMWKISSAGGNWRMYDSKRSPHNVIDEVLYANNSIGEETFDALDFTSNGFKLRTSSGDLNASGATYIFIAFAETPFKYSNAR